MQDMFVTTYFNSYGDLKFSTAEGVQLDPEMDFRLQELSNTELDEETCELIHNYSGSLNALYDMLVEPQTLEDLLDAAINGEDLDEVIKRTAARPRRRRFGGNAARNPITGKRKDPRRRRIARLAARRSRSKRKAAIRKFTRSAKGKRFHKKLGALSARLRRR